MPQTAARLWLRGFHEKIPARAGGPKSNAFQQTSSLSNLGEPPIFGEAAGIGL